MSIDEGLVESARLALYRAQEALGVLLVADGRGRRGRRAGVRRAAVTIPALQAGPWRTDLKLFATQQQRRRARARRQREGLAGRTFEAYVPAVDDLSGAVFRAAEQLAAAAAGDRADLRQRSARAALRIERQAAVDESRAALARADMQARSEVRAAREAMASAERGLGSARAAADQARQVVDIVNISFRAGAATNIEVIDARTPRPRRRHGGRRGRRRAASGPPRPADRARAVPRKLRASMCRPARGDNADK